jgi:hypothetical protein
VLVQLDVHQVLSVLDILIQGLDSTSQKRIRLWEMQGGGQ